MTHPPRRARNSSHAGLRRDQIDAVGVLLGQVRSALFITGAAMSADSGLPAYRGIGGLPRKRVADDGIALETALNSETLASKPKITWKVLREIEHACRSAPLSRGHEVLALLETRIKRFLVLTQNIDGLHQRAGSRNVVEMHGSLYELRCTRCSFKTQVDDYDKLPMPPGCPKCKTVVRPNMVMFGEALAAEPFAALQAELDRGFDIVIAVGTSALPSYIARPVLLAKSEGIPTVEINAGSTDISDLVDFKFRGVPQRVLDLIFQVFQQTSPKRTLVGR